MLDYDKWGAQYLVPVKTAPKASKKLRFMFKPPAELNLGLMREQLKKLLDESREFMSGFLPEAVKGSPGLVTVTFDFKVDTPDEVLGAMFDRFDPSNLYCGRARAIIDRSWYGVHIGTACRIEVVQPCPLVDVNLNAVKAVEGLGRVRWERSAGFMVLAFGLRDATQELELIEPVVKRVAEAADLWLVTDPSTGLTAPDRPLVAVEDDLNLSLFPWYDSEFDQRRVLNGNTS